MWKNSHAGDSSFKRSTLDSSSNAASGQNSNEWRILYVKLTNEINDLVSLEIPLSLLYSRFDMTLEDDVAEGKVWKDERTEAEKERALIFDFQDPRL